MPIYQPIYDGPPKGYSNTYSKKRYIVIHNTSNDAPAVNEASYAKRRTDSVSSHYYVDNKVLIQSLNTDFMAWHAGSSMGNTYGISYEVVGTNSKSRSWWLSNVRWDLLAKQIATDMKKWGISNRHLTVSQMNDGKSTGIVTHDDMRRAWGGTTHTDPGSNFPMDHLIKMVNTYLNEEVDDMAFTDSQMKAFPWQYNGRGMPGVPDGQSTLFALGKAYSNSEAALERLAAIEAKLAAPTPVEGDVTVTVSDEQLERVLRKVLGSVDGLELN